MPRLSSAQFPTHALFFLFLTYFAGDYIRTYFIRYPSFDSYSIRMYIYSRDSKYKPVKKNSGTRFMA